jgi:hypothetical protein
VATAAVARKDVIQRQVACADAAVLADVAIANEDFAPREAHAWSRPLDHVDQPDDGWPGKQAAWCADWDLSVFENLCLAAVHQYKSAARVTHVQRLVVLV